MAEVSIKQFSETLNLSVEKLISQLNESGVKGKKESDSLSEEEKRTLLTDLKSLHGEVSEDAPKKVTLRRKQTLNLSAGSGSGKRTVNVEVRKKRTYVKKPEQVEEPVVEEPIVEEVVVEAPVVETKVEETVAKETPKTVKEESTNNLDKEVIAKIAPVPPKEDHSKAAKKAKDQKHHESKKANDGVDGPKGKGKKTNTRGNGNAFGNRRGKGRKGQADKRNVAQAISFITHYLQLSLITWRSVNSHFKFKKTRFTRITQYFRLLIA